MEACGFHASFSSSAASSVSSSSLLLPCSSWVFLFSSISYHPSGCGFILTLEGISKCPRPPSCQKAVNLFPTDPIVLVFLPKDNYNTPVDRGRVFSAGEAGMSLSLTRYGIKEEFGLLQNVPL